MTYPRIYLKTISVNLGPGLLDTNDIFNVMGSKADHATTAIKI